MTYMSTWYDLATVSAANLNGDKTIAKDKEKADALKDVNRLVKQLKALMDTETELKKRIVSANRLTMDINDFYSSVDALFKEADKLAKNWKKITPDTAKKDFLHLANQLGGLKIDEVKKEVAFK